MPCGTAVPDSRHQRKAFAGTGKPEQCCQNQQPTVAILDVGRMNHRMRQQARGVDQTIPLLATDLLPRIIAFGIDTGPPFSGLFTLWLSMMQAVGLASRSTCSRHFR